MATTTTTITLNILVTPAGNGTYTWVYNTGNTSNQSLVCASNFADVSSDASYAIDLVIASTVSGDTVAFQSPPVQFTHKNGNPKAITPKEFSFSGSGSSVTINDDNNRSKKHPKTHYLYLQAVYTPSGQQGQNISSPDPTIVNAGTGGVRLIFPSHLKDAKVA